ncbi:hypothetical protein XU06_30140 (plasmid) [Rhodococcus erythropolis]|nr:hypothetical protein XU06_30140 [Rhodococcus erythropolis]
MAGVVNRLAQTMASALLTEAFGSAGHGFADRCIDLTVGEAESVREFARGRSSDHSRRSQRIYSVHYQVR